MPYHLIPMRNRRRLALGSKKDLTNQLIPVILNISFCQIVKREILLRIPTGLVCPNPSPSLLAMPRESSQAAQGSRISILKNSAVGYSNLEISLASFFNLVKSGIERALVARGLLLFHALATVAEPDLDIGIARVDDNILGAQVFALDDLDAQRRIRVAQIEEDLAALVAIGVFGLDQFLPDVVRLSKVHVQERHVQFAKRIVSCEAILYGCICFFD